MSHENTFCEGPQAIQIVVPVKVTAYGFQHSSDPVGISVVTQLSTVGPFTLHTLMLPTPPMPSLVMKAYPLLIAIPKGRIKFES
jgi:hypothetical protein